MPLHNKDDLKIEECSSSIPLSINVDWRERERMNSSGL